MTSVDIKSRSYTKLSKEKKYLNENNIILMLMVNNYLVHTVDPNFDLKTQYDRIVHDYLLITAVRPRIYKDFYMLTI